MSRFRIGVIGAVVRKDIISLRLLALGALLLPICLVGQATSTLAPQASASAMMTTIGGLATVALFLTVLHQDSPASDRQDWRSRPIAVTEMLTAKFLFLCLAVGLPMVVAALVQQRVEDHVWSEALLSGLSMLTSALYLVIVIVVLGLVTTSLIEAAAIGFGLIVLGLIGSSLMHAPIDVSGMGWVGNVSGQAVGLIFCAAALWLLFRRKNARAARATWIIGVVLAVSVTRYFPADAAVAVQQMVSPKTAAAARLNTALTEPCIGEGLLAAWKRGASTKPGARATLAVDGLPQGWRVNADHASVHFLDADGRTLRRTGVDTARHPLGGESRGWSLVANAGPVASARTMQWTYALTLLEPIASHDLAVDGRRRFLPGIGYCEATGGRGRGSVIVGCFKPFAQPAMLTATAKGLPLSLCTACGDLNYTPSLLSGFGKNRRTITNLLRDEPVAGGPSVVTLTAYRANAHISRRSSTSAPAANAARVCPTERGEAA